MFQVQFIVRSDIICNSEEQVNSVYYPQYKYVTCLNFVSCLYTYLLTKHN